MIPASLYYSAYLTLVTLMTFITISWYNQYGKLFNVRKTSQIISLFLLVVVVIAIGCRPLSNYFADMVVYESNYNILWGERYSFDWKVDNKIFDNFFCWMASKGIPFSTWVMIISIAYFGLMYIACWKLFRNDVLLAFVVCLGAFSTFSYATNGMKAGVAASLFLVAMAYRDKLWVSIPIALLTYGFHHSMTLVIGSYFVVLFFKNPKYYFMGWIASLILAVLHISYFQVLFAGYTDERGAEYLLATEETSIVRIGFRPDFILYSAVPIYIGYLMIYKYKVQSTTYSFLLRLYIMVNAMWMLCMYASYTNRIAYLSWFMYPIVLLYPFISHDKNQLHGKYLRLVVWCHLGFTLFMKFIYKA